VNKTRGTGSLVWKALSLPAGWHGAILPVSEFPLPERKREEYRSACDLLTERLREDFPEAERQVYLQFHRLLPGEDVERLQENARLWMPEVGLGVWPDREPPRLWTKEDLEEAEEPAKIRPLMFKVLKVQEDPRAGTHAWEAMAGRGCRMLIGCTEPEQFLKHTAELFVPRMQQSVFRSFPFYVPLLESASCAGAGEAEMATWLRFCSYYVRESVEDEGLLAISAKPLDDLSE
jgi:hypothetical protein